MRRSKKRGAVGVLRRLFPEAPDFLSMLSEQCEVLVEAHAALVRRMSDEDAEHEIDLIDAIRRGAETHRALASERRMEELYRAALSDLFRSGRIAGAEGNEAGASPADCFEAVVQILKRREVYRHLSNAADRVASAAETLHAIVVKWT